MADWVGAEGDALRAQAPGHATAEAHTRTRACLAQAVGRQKVEAHVHARVLDGVHGQPALGVLCVRLKMGEGGV